MLLSVMESHIAKKLIEISWSDKDERDILADMYCYLQEMQHALSVFLPVNALLDLYFSSYEHVETGPILDAIMGLLKHLNPEYYAHYEIVFRETQE